MNVKDELLLVLDSALKRAGIPHRSSYKNELSKKLQSNKLDLQDITLVEIMLKEDRDEFENEIVALLKGSQLNEQESITEECIEETVILFIQSLEHSIDYYYNTIISKHFSSS